MEESWLLCGRVELGQDHMVIVSSAEWYDLYIWLVLLIALALWGYLSLPLPLLCVLRVGSLPSLRFLTQYYHTHTHTHTHNNPRTPLHIHTPHTPTTTHCYTNTLTPLTTTTHLSHTPHHTLTHTSHTLLHYITSHHTHLHMTTLLHIYPTTTHHTHTHTHTEREREREVRCNIWLTLASKS